MHIPVSTRFKRSMAWTGVRIAHLMLMCSSLQGLAAEASHYHLLRTMALPAVTGWDYLTIEPSERRLFISNNSGIIVLDVDTLRQVGTIPNPLSWGGVGLVHGIALAPALGRGFISREVPPSVVVFDLRNLTAISTVATGPGTDAIVYDQSTQQVFTFNGKQPGVHDFTVIDAVAGRALKTLPLPGEPQSAAADDAGSLYVNIESESELARIDARSLAVMNIWPLLPCHEPGSLAIDAHNRRLFVGCGNGILIMVDADTGRIVGSVPSGGGTDTVAFEPATGAVFASNGEGSLTVAREESAEHLSLLQQVRTEPGARTMALDTVTHRVFVITARFGRPPAHPTAANPHGYPLVIPGTARLLVFGP